MPYLPAGSADLYQVHSYRHPLEVLATCPFLALGILPTVIEDAA